MKTLIVFCLSMAVSLAYAQSLPRHEEIFKALYGSHYDPATQVAIWHCPAESQSAPDNCRSSKDEIIKKDEIAKIDLLLMSMVEIDGAWKAFVATSAIVPSYDCNACSPPVEIAIFGFHQGTWQIESRNETDEPLGTLGQPAEPELVKIGSKLYGFMFTFFSAGTQGYYETSAQLFAPEGKIIRQIWWGELNEDNRSAYDPTGQTGPKHRIYVEAAYRFLPSGNGDHYVLQVISHGYGQVGEDSYGSRNAVLTYRFVDGSYQQISKPAQRHSKMKIQ